MKTSNSAFNDLDAELQSEFYSCFKEAMEELEHCFAVLDQQYNQDVIDEMFRAVHSVKGNAQMVFLGGIADVCHKLEDLVDQIRKGVCLYTPPQGEFISFIFARLEQLIADIISKGSIADIHVVVLLKAVTYVCDAPIIMRDQVIQITLENLSGILTSGVDLSTQIFVRLARQTLPLETTCSQASKGGSDALEFMELVARQVREQSIHQPGDQDKLLGLCLKLNKLMAWPVEDEQLRAAFYFQALGARFVSSPIFDIPLKCEPWEKEKALEQLQISAGFLRLSAQWCEAAEIVEQSYERYDGLGPLCLTGEKINKGSMIIALVRYYQQCFYKAKKDKKAKIAVSKALGRINSEKSYRFSPEVVSLFNQVVHSDLLGVSW